MLPFFSIIIPVYNTEKYIARCLDSCIHQSFDDIEIIVVDDCGQDKAMQIAQDYALKDQRIQIVQNPQNLGLFAARIAGEKVSKGAYIIALDSDDFLDLQTCQILQKHIISSQQQDQIRVDIIYFGAQRYPKRKKDFMFKRPKVSHGFKILQDNAFGWEVWGKAYSKDLISHSHHLLKQTFLLIPHINMGEDVLKTFTLNAIAQKAISIEDKLYFYFDAPTSITKTSKNLDAALKNMHNLNFVINGLNQIENTLNPLNHPHLQTMKEKIQSALKEHHKIWEYKSFIAQRFDSKPFSYPKIYLASLALQADYKRVLPRVLLYFCTFGLIKI